MTGILDKEKSNDLQEYADIVCSIYRVAPVKIHVKDIGGGRARYKTRFISIPLWAYTDKSCPSEFPLYYLLHEVTHMIDHDRNGGRKQSGRKPLAHDQIFKAIEKDVLRQAGISITYKKAYPDTLTANGQTHKCK